MAILNTCLLGFFYSFIVCLNFYLLTIFVPETLYTSPMGLYDMSLTCFINVYIQ